MNFGIQEWIVDPRTAQIYLAIGHTNQVLQVDVDPDIGMNESQLNNGNGTFVIDTSHTWGGASAALTLTDTNTTVHTLKAGSQDQFTALNAVCTNGSSANCTFIPTGRGNTVGESKLVGPVIPNETNVKLEDAYTWNSDTTMTGEWGVSATLTAGVEDVVSAAIEASYSQTFSHTVSTGGSLTLPIDVGYTGWMTYASPVERVTGNFTITLGNDTWNLPAVHFDLFMNDNGDGGVLTAHEVTNGDPSIPNGSVGTAARPLNETPHAGPRSMLRASETMTGSVGVRLHAAHGPETPVDYPKL